MAKRKLNVRTIRKKIELEGIHSLYKYEEDHYWKYLVAENDKYTSWIVRKRDCPRPKNPCVTAGIPVCKGPITRYNSQCCHAIRRGYYSHRRDLKNVYAGCRACNCFGLQDHVNAITAHVIKIHGQEVRDEMRVNKNMVKPKIRELEELLQQQIQIYENM